jgi:hypothetical protein
MDLKFWCIIREGDQKPCVPLIEGKIKAFETAGKIAKANPDKKIFILETIAYSVAEYQVHNIHIKVD